MVRSTRILHNNEEYLIQDNGASTASRRIIFLARPESAASEGGTGQQPIQTNHGVWIPIAKWERGGITPITDGARRLTPGLKTVLNIYLRRANRTDTKAKRRIYYYVEREGEIDYVISPAHPHGLAVKIFSKKSAALKERMAEKEASQLPAAAKESLPFSVRQTNNLREFLIKAADDGYAGAVLDGKEPLYFCLNPMEHILFLRLSMNDEDEVEEFLLEEDGTWTRYDGEGDLEFYLDQDRCDLNMVRNLGEIPFIGYDNLKHLWTVEEIKLKGSPYILSEKDDPYREIPESRSVLLFLKKRSAMEFLLDRGLVHCEGVRIDDLKSFLQTAGRKSLNVLLEPFGHRAASGALWMNGNDIILDSFSGFWILGEGGEFTRAV